MKNYVYTLVAENGDKELLRFLPETDDDFTAVGATEDEIKEFFPDYKIEGLDAFLYKYFIRENGIIHIKSPDGQDITEEVLGKGVFDS